jgi:hypothetical protein
MNKGLFFDGVEFISASQAAKKIGYASDYVGQLCRQEKIPCRLIGRTWYVDYSALVDHKKNNSTRKKKLDLPTQNKIVASKVVALPEKKAEPILLKDSFTKFTPEKVIEPKSRLPEIKKPLQKVQKIQKVKKSNFLLPVGVALVLILVAGLAVGLMTGTDNSAPATVTLSNNGTSTSNTSDLNGMVVTPDSSDHAGLVARIKSFFSDDVNISFDQDNNTGVITPVFQNGTTSDHYAFVMVPVNKKQ